MCRLVVEETGLPPHTNPWPSFARGTARTRAGERQPGNDARNYQPPVAGARPSSLPLPRQGSRERLAALRRPESCAFRFTTGILIGIGETQEERVDALFSPEMPWPESPALSAVPEDAGFELRKRLAAYPEYLRQPGLGADKRSGGAGICDGIQVY